MNLLSRSVLALSLCIGFFARSQAQPTFTSNPSNGGTLPTTTSPVVFTFSAPMDTTATSVQFIDGTTFTPISTSDSWSAGDTVLTCTAVTSFPANKTVYWSLSGQDPIGNPVDGAGYFSTSSGSTGGSGTNKITTFALGKMHVFDQYSTAAPVTDTNIPYDFTATTTLASNRTATSITLALPTGAVSNLTQNFVYPEDFYMFASYTNQTSLDTNFPFGTYTFNVTGSSNQTVPVNLPSTLVQPPAPYVTNFTAAQSVNPTQAFTLNWDSFSGGTASDYILVNVGGVFRTPDFNAPGALNGTATSVVIPANTLQASSNYDASIGFYRAIVVSNTTYATIAYVATVTDFNLSTTSGGAAVTLILTNNTWTGGQFNFDVTAPPSQTITVEYSPSMLPGSWLSLLTTNAPAGGRVHVSDAHSTTNRYLFYRARTGT